LAALVLVFALKCFSPGQPWGITFGAAEPLPAVAALHTYYELARPNELILVDSDDDLYAAALPLPRVRYCFLDPDDVVRKYAPHYATLGITLTEEEFENLDYLEPAYEARLRKWGLDSSEPIGTAIIITSRSMLPGLFRAYRNSDFYVSDADWELLQRETPVDQTHQTITASNGRKFLLARYPSQRRTAHLTQVPTGW
jgi:hypothetical protein